MVLNRGVELMFLATVMAQKTLLQNVNELLLAVFVLVSLVGLFMIREENSNDTVAFGYATLITMGIVEFPVLLLILMNI